MNIHLGHTLCCTIIVLYGRVDYLDRSSYFQLLVYFHTIQYVINELLSTGKVNFTNNYQDQSDPDPRSLNKHLSWSLEHYFSKIYLWKRPTIVIEICIRFFIKFGPNKPFYISYYRKGIQYPPNRNFKQNLR